MASGSRAITPLTDATLSELRVLRRIMTQPIRDAWPGVNQPYEPEEEPDGD